MSRVTIRRFDVIRAANIAAVLYAVIVAVVGLLIFLPFSLIAGVAGSRAGDSGVGVGLLGAGIAGALIFTLFGTVFYAITGWIMTAIMVALYNVVARRIGGIQADVEIQGPYGLPGYGGPGYPAPGYPVPGSGNPAWPAPGAPGGAPVPPPPGWGQPG
jgi:hypothetical protein